MNQHLRTGYCSRCVEDLSNYLHSVIDYLHRTGDGFDVGLVLVFYMTDKVVDK